MDLLNYVTLVRSLSNEINDLTEDKQFAVLCSEFYLYSGVEYSSYNYPHLRGIENLSENVFNAMMFFGHSSIDIFKEYYFHGEVPERYALSFYRFCIENNINPPHGVMRSMPIPKSISEEACFMNPEYVMFVDDPSPRLVKDCYERYRFKNQETTFMSWYKDWERIMV